MEAEVGQSADKHMVKCKSKGIMQQHITSKITQSNGFQNEVQMRSNSNLSIRV